jgi:hypothetical protein
MLARPHARTLARARGRARTHTCTRMHTRAHSITRARRRARKHTHGAGGPGQVRAYMGARGYLEYYRDVVNTVYYLDDSDGPQTDSDGPQTDS